MVCVEPNPLVARALRKTLDPYVRQGRAVVVETALGEASGERALWVDRNNAGASHLISPSLRGDASTQATLVPVIRLDELVELYNLPRVDFVKLDVEGAERSVLSGATDVLKRYKPRLAIASYHRREDWHILPALVRAACNQYTFESKGAAKVRFLFGVAG